jgi:hypothetical protein
VTHDVESWKQLGLVPSSGQSLSPPALGTVPGDKKEDEEPWQVARGSTFTMGLPPGFQARRTDAGVSPPVEIPGTALWFRGRFTDVEGNRVVVGDGERAGYVAFVEPRPEGWAAGKQAPVGAPGAERAAAEPFPLIADRADATAATAERWTESGFAGDWLVFRLSFDDRGVEIGLPVLAGRRSPSLYWIAATWRGADKPPAPPPVDPAERFGIRFERLRPSERIDQPWTQGYLSVPGMRFELPLGWFPAASLRSRDGYPVRFLDESGQTLGLLDRVDSDELQEIVPGSGGWVESERPRRHRAGRVLSRESGLTLFVASEGHAFLFEPADELDTEARGLWERLLESVQLSRDPASSRAKP